MSTAITMTISWSWAPISSIRSPQIVLDVYLNEGKPRSSAEDVTFTKQRLILKSHDNADAAMDKVKFSGGFDLQVVDLDNDGNPDILASSCGDR